jgi:hypothetical protein
VITHEQSLSLMFGLNWSQISRFGRFDRDLDDKERENLDLSLYGARFVDLRGEGREFEILSFPDIKLSFFFFLPLFFFDIVFF